MPACVRGVASHTYDFESFMPPLTKGFSPSCRHLSASARIKHDAAHEERQCVQGARRGDMACGVRVRLCEWRRLRAMNASCLRWKLLSTLLPQPLLLS